MISRLGELLYRRARRSCLADVQETVNQFDALPFSSSTDQERLRRLVSMSAIRVHFSDLRIRYIAPLAGAAATGMAAACLFVVLQIDGDALHRIARAGGYVAGVISYCILFALVIEFYMKSFSPGKHENAFGVTFGLMNFGLLAILWVWRDQLQSWRFPIAVGFAMMAGVMLVATVCAPILFEVERRSSRARCLPSDRVLVEAVGVANCLHVERYRARKRGTKLEWCRRIQALAWIAETELSLRYSTLHTAPEVRKSLREESTRIAAVFWSHQLPLVKATSAQEVGPVIESLIKGIDALARQDREALLSVSPSEVARSARLLSWVKRLTPGLILIAAGIVLPMLPQVSSQPAAASSMRLILVIAGLMNLISARTDVIAQVSSQLDKSVKWK